MIISKKSVILILISVFLTNSVGMVVFTYIPRYLMYLGTDKPLTQLIVSIFPLTAFLFPPLFGYISDKIQNRVVFIFSGSLGISLVFLLLSLTQDLTVSVVFLFFFGLFFAASNISFTLYAELVEDDKKLISYQNATIVAGWFTGAQFGGIFIDIFGIEKIFSLILVISLTTIFFVVFIREKRSLILESYKSRGFTKQNSLNVNKNEKKTNISTSIYGGLFFRNSYSLDSNNSKKRGGGYFKHSFCKSENLHSESAAFIYLQNWLRDFNLFNLPIIYFGL